LKIVFFKLLAKRHHLLSTIALPLNVISVLDQALSSAYRELRDSKFQRMELNRYRNAAKIQLVQRHQILLGIAQAPIQILFWLEHYVLSKRVTVVKNPKFF
jgi:hypothetical protein